MVTLSPTTKLDIARNRLVLNTWINIVNLAKKDRKRQERRGKNLSVHFNKDKNNDEPPVVELKEFNPNYASRSIKFPNYKGIKYENETPWYENEESEEMPWWEYPDLDEDDELTCLCKKVIAAGDYDMTSQRSITSTKEDDEHQRSRRVNRVQGIVYDFALRLKNKVARKNYNSHGSERGNFSLNPSWSNSSSWLSNSIHKWSNSSISKKSFSIPANNDNNDNTMGTIIINQNTNPSNSDTNSNNESCEDDSERSFSSESSSLSSTSFSDSDSGGDSDSDSVTKNIKSCNSKITIEETKIFRPSISASMMNKKFNLRRKKFGTSRAA